MNKNTNIKSKLPQTTTDWLVLVLIIIAILSLGWLGLNQFMGYIYKAQLLSAPCDLCRESNPFLDRCFYDVQISNPAQVYINISPEEMEDLFQGPIQEGYDEEVFRKEGIKRIK